MSDKFVTKGDVEEVTLGGTVLVDDVDVIGTGKIGVAHSAGVSGEKIVYGIKGVYKIPKVSAAVITKGQKVLWDASAGAVDDDLATPAAGDFFCGYAFESAGNGVTEIAVDINVTAPAVT
jgi:predicted RecA/RadA family phage recombinase